MVTEAGKERGLPAAKASWPSYKVQPVLSLGAPRPGAVPEPVPPQDPSTSSPSTAATATWSTTCTATSTPSCSAAPTSAARPAPSSTATRCPAGSRCPGTQGGFREPRGAPAHSLAVRDGSRSQGGQGWVRRQGCFTSQSATRARPPQTGRHPVGMIRLGAGRPPQTVCGRGAGPVLSAL